MANILSAAILILFFYGRSLRFKNLKWHIRLMMFAMTADIFLVASLVVFRDALSKVQLGMPWTLFVHIPFAISTVVLYFFAAWNGYRLYRGHEAARPKLRAYDRALCVARVMTLVTSLMVQFIAT